MQHLRNRGKSRKLDPVAEREWNGVAARLHEDMKARGLSIRGLAKILAGEGATADEIEQERGYVQRWLRMTGGRGLTTKNDARLAAALGTEPGRYHQPPPSPEELEEREVSRLQARLRELGALP